MKALVTGGAGFIGSHIVENLLKNRHQVIVIDNFSTGRIENLDHIKDHKDLRIIQADITDFNCINPYFKDIDWVFHIAGLADIVPSIERPLEYYKTNVDGTVNVLECAREANVKKFIYAASSSCYGIPKEYPTKETALICPQYPYALTKYLGEECVLHWGKVYKLPVVSLRLFNVYGPRSRTSGTYGAVFGVFLAQKLSSKPFTVVGDGRQTRDFIYVEDTANAFIKAAESGCINEIFNVGSGSTYSINYLTQLLEGDVVYIPKRPGEPQRTHADISRIKSTLNWSPKISFEQGVKRLLAGIDYWKNAPVWTAENIENETRTWFECLS